MIVEARPDHRTGKKEQRAEKRNPSREAVARYNQKVSIRNLTMLLNNNFGVGDHHLILTYAEEPTKENAGKAVKNFLKRARRRARKRGTELRYILITELGEKRRIHHHIIIGGLPSEEIRELWEAQGHTIISFLYPSGDYSALAAYLLKETQANLKAGIITKRWSGSRNLKKPKVKEKPMKRWNLTKTPKEYRHYKLLDWENVVNPITGTLSQWAYYLRI